MARPDAPFRDAMLAHLKQKHSDIWRQWFEAIEPIDISGGVLTLLVHEPVQLRYLQRRCAEPFTEAARAVTGHLLVVRFVGEETKAAYTDGRMSGRPGNGNGAEHANGAHGSLSVLGQDDEMLLSPDYTFDTFVVGPGNRLAHAAAQAVAKMPGRAYNPLFIHAGVGLGKTHLLHAICQIILRQSPDTRIFYTSCENFITQFVNAVQRGLMNEFRLRFRNVDLLLIDDIHDLSKRNQSQEEFFHTFNSLYHAGRQIVLSSDAAPDEIPDLEERLVSRFYSGLVARIERPCFETRVAIVMAKAALRNLTLPDDVASFIATCVDTNIRELEGALTRIQGFSVIHNEPITLELARRALDRPGAVGTSTHRLLSIQDIVDAIVRYYDVRLSDLLSKKRHKSITQPRQMAMYLARQRTRYSLEEIGGYFGGRDHTTVMHAVRTIEDRLVREPGLQVDAERLLAALERDESTQPRGRSASAGQNGG